MSLTGEEVAAYLYDAGFRGEDLVNIVAIAHRESGWDPGAHRTNRDPSAMVGDFGLLQINYVNDTEALRQAVGYETTADLLNPEVNARAAFHLYQQRGLDPWTAGEGGWRADGDPMFGTDVDAARQAVEQARELGRIGDDADVPDGPISPVAPAAPRPAPPTQPEALPTTVDPAQAAAEHAGGVDTDLDMLPDHFEVRHGLDPAQADTDGDGITDGYELIVHHTSGELADSDFDGRGDSLELAVGDDPLTAATDDMIVPDTWLADTDGDGLSDWGEVMAGTDRHDADTDADGVVDGDELFTTHQDPTADA